MPAQFVERRIGRSNLRKEELDEARNLKMRLRRPVLVGAIFLLAGILAVSIALQIRGAARLPKGKGKHLGYALPLDLPARQSQEVSVGTTEAATAAATEVLRFDDVFYRRYTHAVFGELTVYVAYWNPGKMPVRSISYHIPDNCWPASGWECAQRNDEYSFGSTKNALLPASWRRFVGPGGHVRYVAFWHLIGGRLYRDSDFPSLVVNPIKYIFSNLSVGDYFQDSKEQYFFRLVSDTPFEALGSDEGLASILRCFGNLGLADLGSRTGSGRKR